MCQVPCVHVWCVPVSGMSPTPAPGPHPLLANLDPRSHTVRNRKKAYRDRSGEEAAEVGQEAEVTHGVKYWEVGEEGQKSRR